MITTNIIKSPKTSIKPEENTSEMASMSETTRVTKEPIGVVIKVFHFKSRQMLKQFNPNVFNDVLS
jgi:hypothetical protein